MGSRYQPLLLRGAAVRLLEVRHRVQRDRKSTRLNSSHSQISYAVFCLKKKKEDKHVSLAERLPVMYCDTPTCMEHSALEYLQVCGRHVYCNHIISLAACLFLLMLPVNG